MTNALPLHQTATLDVELKMQNTCHTYLHICICISLLWLCNTVCACVSDLCNVMDVQLHNVGVYFIASSLGPDWIGPAAIYSVRGSVQIHFWW